MDPRLINNVVYYLIVGIQIVLGLSIIALFILWLISDQTLNVERKKKAGIYLFIAIGVFYILRFGSIFIFSMIYSNGFSSTVSDAVINILRMLQLMIIAFVPTFAMLQAFIFKYQALITERPDSKKRMTFYRMTGLVATVAIVILLQLMISLL